MAWLSIVFTILKVVSLFSFVLFSTFKSSSGIVSNFARSSGEGVMMMFALLFKGWNFFWVCKILPSGVVGLSSLILFQCLLLLHGKDFL